MENVLKHLIFVLVLFVGLNASATDGLTVKVTNNQTLVVEVENRYNNGILALKDQNGEILFKDSLLGRAVPFMKLLNLEEIEEGIYYLSFENEYEIRTEVITKTASKVAVIEGAESIFFKPAFRVEGKKVKFHLTNPFEKMAVVTVYDSRGIVIGKVKTRKSVIGKILDFSSMPSGDYNIAVNVGEHRFTKKLKL